MRCNATGRKTFSVAIFFGVAQIVLQGLALQFLTITPENLTDAPLRDFSFVLTFDEVVQSGVGTIEVKTEAESRFLACDLALQYLDTFAFVPIKEELSPESDYTLLISRTCVRNRAGEHLAEDLRSNSFRTIRKGSSIDEFDVKSPVAYSVVMPSQGMWVPSTAQFVLFFSEAVQAGDAPVTIVQSVRSLANEPKVFAEIPGTQLLFDHAIPGKVTVDPKGLTPGAEYELIYSSESFRDLAGNYAQRSAVSFAGTPYTLKVSAGLLPSRALLRYPAPGGVAPPSTNIVLEFSEPVSPGVGEIALCQGQGQGISNECQSPTTVPVSHMFFLARTVIINPIADLLPGAAYNISIPSTVVEFFDGLAPSSRHSFAVAPPDSDASYDNPPLLVAGLVDCNGDRELADVSGVGDQCDTDGDGVADFRELEDAVSADRPMLIGARFQLYFADRVAISGAAELQADDGEPPSRVLPVVGVVQRDCVVELAPDLAAGWLYNLSLAEGVITGTHSRRTPFQGTYFTFFTPMGFPTSLPRDGETEVSRTTAILLTFPGTPRLGLPGLIGETLGLSIKFEAVADVAKGLEVKTRTVDLTDEGQVRFQGSDVLILPQPPLQAGRRYRVLLPRQSIRYMTRDFSFTFSTRAEDNESPRVVLQRPPSGIYQSAALSAVAPFVLFSESVRPAAGKYIQIDEDGMVLHRLHVSDSSCVQMAPCVELDSWGKKLTIYPRGRNGGIVVPWVLPNRSYTITLEDGAFLDLSSGSDAQANAVASVALVYCTFESGAASGESFSVDERVHIVSWSPANASEIDYGDVTILITFNEEVQRGEGSIRVCANLHGATCEPLLFMDGSNTSTHGSMQVIVDSRRLQLRFQRHLRPRQRIHVILLDDAVHAVHNTSRRNDAVKGSAYVLVLSDRDIRKPFLLDYVAPTSVVEDLVLYFSEAVQAGQVPVAIVDASSGALVPDAASRIDGTVVAISARWSGNATYHLKALTNSFVDLAGNIIAGDEYKGSHVEHNFTVIDDPGPDGNACWSRQLVVKLEPRMLAVGEDNETADDDTGTGNLISNLTEAPMISLAGTASAEVNTSIPNVFAGNRTADGWSFWNDSAENATSESVAGSDVGSSTAAAWNSSLDGSENDTFEVRSTDSETSTAALRSSASNGTAEQSTTEDNTTIEESDAWNDTEASFAPHKTTTTATTRTTTTVSTSTATTITTTTTTKLGCDAEGPELVSMYPYAGAADLRPDSEDVLVGMYFSEEVRLGDTNLPFLEDDSGSQIQVAPVLIAQSGVSVPVPRAMLVAGRSLSVNLPEGSVTDRSGNAAPTIKRILSCEPDALGIVPSSVSFSINNAVDRTGPAAKIVPTIGAEVHLHDVLSIQFDEVVQRGSGHIVVYSAEPLGCEGSACVYTQTVATLPVVSLPMSTVVADGRVVSIVNVDTGIDMLSERSYSMTVAEGSFRDVSGNPFAGLEIGEYTMAPTLKKDSVPPRLIAADIGNRGSPNPAFDGDHITLYFSEAVQEAARGATMLLPSTGGAFCSADNTGGCGPGEFCSSPCNYDPASSIRIMAPVSIEGNVVVVRSDLTMGEFGRITMNLESGKGYKLVVEEAAFQDLEGNMNQLYDGETASGAYVLRTAYVDLAHSISPQSFWPESGASKVPPSTSLQVTYSSNVKAGRGIIRVGPHRLAARTCSFRNITMTCVLPSVLAHATEYTVNVPADAVMGLLGEEVRASTWSFTTIDLDYTPPSLLQESWGYDVVVPRGALLTLIFNEVVQLGRGNIVFADCSPGDPQLCYDGDSELVPDIESTRINVTGDASEALVYLDGSTVYVDHTDFWPHARHSLNYYSMTMDRAGVFYDVRGNPLPRGSSGLVFAVGAEDETYPQLYQQVPIRDTSLRQARPAPNTDIVLYFSEAVQVGAQIRNIVVTDSSVTNVIPADNSAASQGRVSVHGNKVTIDPFDDMGYNKIVVVTVPADAFEDLNGHGIPLTSYRFRTQESTFHERHSGNSSGSFPPREGAVLFHNGTALFLFGGQNNSHCFDDLWTSVDGATWTAQRQDAVQNRTGQDDPSLWPLAAKAPTTMDGKGCLWLLGGDCNFDSDTIWKGCPLRGRISWVRIPRPRTVPMGVEAPPAFPSEWSGHAIVIVGGWQLVLVSAVERSWSQSGHAYGVWKFLDAEAEHVQRVLGHELPFGSRRDPALLATSDARIFLVGGHRCADTACSDGYMLQDVWTSSDTGHTWSCLTVNYASGSAHEDFGGWRYMSAVTTADDTIFLMGGQRLDSPEGSTDVFIAAPGSPDVSFEPEYLQWPVSLIVPLLNMRHSIYFTEAVQQGKGTMKLYDLGQDMAEGGNGLAADREVDFSLYINNHEVTITPLGLQPGHKYLFITPDDSLTDLAGNPLTCSAPCEKSATCICPYTFTVDSDTTPPVVVSVHPTGADVAPWTTVMLTFSETVLPGSGELVLVPRVGRRVALPIADALLVEDKVFFEQGPSERLTEGQVYTIVVPTGLLLDKAGNAVAAQNVSNFTVLSGSYTENNYSWNGEPSVRSVADGTQGNHSPEFVRAHPADGATDVLCSEDVAIALYYSGPVEISKKGMLQFFDSNSVLAGFIDLKDATAATVLAQEVREAHLVQFRVPWVLANYSIESSSGERGGSLGGLRQPGVTYTLVVPRGAVTDVSGNELDGVNISFTCLAGARDRSTPRMVLADPLPNQQGVRSTINELRMYFSEPVLPGIGTITLGAYFSAHLSKRLPIVALPMSHPNVSVSGARVTVRFFSGLLHEGATNIFSVEIPEGAVRDLPRGVEGGNNSFAGVLEENYRFMSAARDSIRPRLTNRHPPSETTPSFTLPQSATLLLTFTEDIQLGPPDADSVVRLVPTYGTETIVCNAADMVIVGEKVVVTPPHGLMAGEVYTVEVGATAFRDLDDNYYMMPQISGSSATWYSISVLRDITFTSFTHSHWIPRYGAAAAVGPRNEVYLAGGKHGLATGHAAVTWLNDVWVMDTARETKCAFGGKPQPCSKRECSLDNSGHATLGTREVRTTIWRAPSADGKSCIDAAGVPRRRNGNTLQVHYEECPCPWCTKPPQEPLPQHMVNSSYLSSYVMLGASDETRPLLCERGYVPTGEFTCIADTDFIGSFRRPYPQCSLAPCTSPPNTSTVSHFARLVDESCTTISSDNPLPHNDTCPMLCQYGWQSGTGYFKCKQGVFQNPVCTRQKCSTDDLLLENGIVDSEVDFLFGEHTTARCAAGYELFVRESGQEFASKRAEVSVVCDTNTTEPEARPYLRVPSHEGVAECRKNDCGLFTGDLSLGSLEYQGTLLGARAKIVCPAGYIAVHDGPLVCGPRVNAVGEGEVEWQNVSGAVATKLCRILQCPAPVDPNGKYVNKSGEAATEKWQLVCDYGYSPVDAKNTVATCSVTEQLTQPGHCVYSGGCNSSFIDIPSGAVNGTTCPKWLHEGDTCTVTCKMGQPVGEFKCLLMVLVGRPSCALPTAETKVVKKLAGSIGIEVTLPADAVIKGGTFQNAIQGALAQSFGVWPKDFSGFMVRLVESGRAASAPSARRNPSRRLGQAKPVLEIAYELYIQDDAKRKLLKARIPNIATAGTVMRSTFVSLLLQKGVQAWSITILRPATEFEDRIVVSEQKSRSRAALEYDTLSEPEDLKTWLIFGGFFGGMIGLCFAALVVLLISARRRAVKKG